MSPDQFLVAIQKSGPPPVALFLGPEPYQRDRCRKALLTAVLGDAPEDREQGLTRFDLSEIPLAAALDDARSMSLFASKRGVWIGGAEAVLPRGRAAAASEEDDEEKSGTESDLLSYLRQPTPGVTVVLEASRYGFEGDDKAKIGRAHV